MALRKIAADSDLVEFSTCGIGAEKSLQRDFGGRGDMNTDSGADDSPGGQVRVPDAELRPAVDRHPRTRGTRARRHVAPAAY